MKKFVLRKRKVLKPNYKPYTLPEGFGEHRIKYPWRKMKIGESFIIHGNSHDDLRYKQSVVQNAGRIFLRLNKIDNAKVSVRQINKNTAIVYLLKKNMVGI